MQVLGIPRSGFSLLISALDHLIPWNWEQREQLSSLNSILGKKLFKNFFLSLSDSPRTIWSGEFDSVTGGPKIFDDKFLRVRKYLGFIDKGDIVFEISLNKKFVFLNHVFHSHYFNINEYSNQPTLISNRNPCGIFESAIHSLNAMTSEYIQIEYPNLSSDEIESIRNEIALYKFSRKDVVKALMNFQVNETNKMVTYIKNTKNNAVFQWEDLILSESDSFQRIHKFLKKYEIKVRNLSEAKEIFYQNINKNLLKFHKHNYRVGHAIRDGWVFGLPYSLSNMITDSIKKIDENKIVFQDYRKHRENLDINKHVLHTHGKLVEEVLKEPNLYESELLNKNIMEFSMNKSNLNAADLNDDNICNLSLGFVHINKMSRELEYLIPSFQKLDKDLEKINNAVDDHSIEKNQFSIDLKSKIIIGQNLIGKLN